MKNIFFIALNTAKEIQSQKAFYALTACFFLGLGLGLIAGTLSLSEQKHLSINFTYTACHISLILMALYFAGQAIPRERERQSFLLLFTRPVSKGEFIIGKFFGLTFILLGALCCLTGLVFCLYGFYERDGQGLLLMAMSGIFMEALLLSALSLFFSVFMPAFLVLVYSFVVFIVGHSVSSLLFFVSKSDGIAKWGVSALVRILPDLERLNWRAHALYQDPLSWEEWAFSSFYSLSYTVLLLLSTVIVFQKKTS